MYCLHCGECCRTMCPVSEEQCKFLIETEGFYLCSIYNDRPQRCREHEYHGYRVCPIGADKLGISTAEQFRLRVDRGFELGKCVEVE